MPCAFYCRRRTLYKHSTTIFSETLDLRKDSHNHIVIIKTEWTEVVCPLCFLWTGRLPFAYSKVYGTVDSEVNVFEQNDL